MSGAGELAVLAVGAYVADLYSVGLCCCAYEMVVIDADVDAGDDLFVGVEEY